MYQNSGLIPLAPQIVRRPSGVTGLKENQVMFPIINDEPIPRVIPEGLIDEPTKRMTLERFNQAMKKQGQVRMDIETEASVEDFKRCGDGAVCSSLSSFPRLRFEGTICIFGYFVG